MSLAWRVLQWLIWHIWKNRLLNRLEVVCARHLSFLPVFGFESVISGSVWWSLSTCKRKSRARLRYWQIRMQKGLSRRGENYRCVCPRGGGGLCSFIRRYMMRLSASPFHHSRLIRSVIIWEVKNGEILGKQPFCSLCSLVVYFEGSELLQEPPLLQSSSHPDEVSAASDTE